MTRLNPIAHPNRLRTEKARRPARRGGCAAYGLFAQVNESNDREMRFIARQLAAKDVNGL